jgi:hypothetical protein
VEEAEEDEEAEEKGEEEGTTAVARARMGPGPVTAEGERAREAQKKS